MSWSNITTDLAWGGGNTRLRSDAVGQEFNETRMAFATPAGLLAIIAVADKGQMNWSSTKQSKKIKDETQALWNQNMNVRNAW